MVVQEAEDGDTHPTVLGRRVLQLRQMQKARKYDLESEVHLEREAAAKADRRLLLLLREISQIVVR